MRINIKGGYRINELAEESISIEPINKLEDRLHDAVTHRETWLQIFRAGMNTIAKVANDGDNSSYLAHEEEALKLFLDQFSLED